MSEIVICPHCLASNRVPRERLAQTPNCGKCHQALFSGHALAVNAGAFTAHTDKGTLPAGGFLGAVVWSLQDDGPRLRAGRAFTGAEFTLAQGDTEIEQALAGVHGIRSIPTLVLLSGGREVKRVSGAMDARRIVDWARE